MKYLKKTLFLALTFFFCFVLLVACGEQEIKIEVESSMTVGQSYDYAVKLDSETISDYEISLNPKGIIEVDKANSKIKALAEGTVTITISAGDDLIANVEVTVVAPAAPREYTITYNLNGGVAEGLVDKYTEADSDVILGTPTKEGFDFAGWYDNEELEGEAITKIAQGSTGNKVFYAKWTEKQVVVEYVTVSFYGGLTGDVLIEEQKIEKGSNATAPSLDKIPVVEGMEFISWKGDYTNVQADIKITAKYDLIMYKINFYLFGELYTSVSAAYGDSCTPPLEEYVSGYKFAGWDKTEELESVTQDLDVYGTYTPIEYNVQFFAGNIEFKQLATTYNIESEDELPTVSGYGYTFEGWYSDSVNGELVTSLNGNTGDKKLYAKLVGDFSEITVDPSLANIEEGTNVEHTDGNTYTMGIGLCANIAQAVSTPVAEGATLTINVAAGTYEESFKIEADNVILRGPNYDVKPRETRKEEAVIKGTITVNGNNVSLEGLAFTGAGKVTGGIISGFRFANNYVYDTNANATKWAEAATAAIGWLNIRGASGSQIKDFEFADNYFKNIQDSCIALAYVNTVLVHGNVFEDYTGDGIRFDHGGYNDGLLALTNNEFVQSEKGGATGIYFRIYGGPGQNTDIVIKGNLFKNIGNVDNLYSGAISARNYQEHGAYITISDNDFINCKNFIRIRNNATAANHAASIWECVIENNNFIGAPEAYYFVNKNGGSGDTEATNPSLTVVKGNFYADSEGNMITPNAGFFKDCKSVEAGLESKVENEVEDIKYFTIKYEMNGGTYKGLLVSRYHELTGEVILPTPSKEGYIFTGWYVGQTKYETISGDMKEDLVLEAVWEKDTRVFIEFNVELNGGNWNYESYEDVALDLLNDYNIYSGNGYTRENIPTGPWVNINFHTFFYAEVNGVLMSEKWAWLAEYLGKVGGPSNKKGCALLNENTDPDSFDDVNANYKYGVSYEFRGFIMGKQHDTNASYLSADWSLTELQNGIWEYVHKNTVTTGKVEQGDLESLPSPVKPYYTFVGWYLDVDLTKAVTENPDELVEGVTLYAKWRETNPVVGLEITNKITELLYKGTYTLEWKFNPVDASNQNINIVSSDENILTVNSKGEIVAVGEGTATITITSQSNPDAKDSITVTVYSPDRINAEFVENSYAEVGESLQIHAEYISRNEEIKELEWSSKDPSVATVDQNGLVTGVSAGTTVITVKVKGTDISMDIEVTIIESGLSDLMKLIISSHNSNVYVTEQMLIALAYRTDIHGSVSDILYNYDYKLDESITIPVGSNRPGTKMSSVEFITVHYTAGAPASSTAKATANYFKNGGGGASIHYCTGNDGIYHTMPDDEVAYHAGDGTGTKFEWNPTGVKVKADDPARPLVDVSSDGYFTVNGEKTTIKCPGGYDKNLQQNVQPNDQKNYFTLLGPAIDVFNGEYHIGTTWWCNSQVAEGRVSSHGGNLNSIGIESACNMGSDLWYTWQITAQLVAHLMEQNNLAINRVVGHNFFSGKDCPQPLLEKEGEIWWQFIECVESEYEILTKYQDYEISFESNNPEIVNDKGRVIDRPEYSTSVSYTVKITKDGQTQEVTLSSIIPGYYEKVME